MFLKGLPLKDKTFRTSMLFGSRYLKYGSTVNEPKLLLLSALQANKLEESCGGRNSDSLEKSANQGDGGLMPLENNLAQVGIYASFTLKGERVKSNTSCFPLASEGMC